MKAQILICIAMLFFVSACKQSSKSSVEKNSACSDLKIRSEIESAIRQTTDCNKKKDIDCFMDTFDSLFILESNEAADSNRVILKDTVRKDVLRDWSIIATMYEVERWIDSIHVASPDSAIVFTDQFYHRTFTKPRNLPGIDDVVSTQKHRETWVRRGDGWKQQRVKELGGSVYVNGKPYPGQ